MTITYIKKQIFQLITKYFSGDKNHQSIQKDCFSDLTTSSYDHYLSYRYLLKTVQQNFDFHTEDPYSHRPLFSPQEFSQIYSQLISKEHFSSNQNKKILHHILADTSFIYKTLSPLESLGLKFSLDLVGGAARDLLLDKPIKDLDICLYWNDSYGIDITDIQKEYDSLSLPSLFENFEEKRNKINTRILSFINYQEIQKVFTNEEILSVNYSENDSIQDIINKLLLMCLNRTKDVSFVKLFSEEDRFIPQPDSNYGPQMTEILTSLIKIGTKHTYFPIDLIATDKNRYDFIKNVDFDICKIGFCLTNIKKIHNENLKNELIESKSISLPLTIDDFVKRAYTSSEFWEDVYRKTITFNAKDKTIAQIQFSFDERSGRLIKKYPDYPIVITSQYAPFYAEANVALLASKLTLDLDKQSEPKVIKRAKI